jgi:hypothetical protein
MKKSSTWDFRSIVGKIMLGLVLVTMIGSIIVVTAFGKDNHSRGRGHERGHGRGHGRGHVYSYGYGYGRGYYPPPVIYAPPPPPGIGIFFPPIVIRP